MDNYNDNQFIIDTDQKAEWAIRKIAEASSGSTAVYRVL